MDELSQADNYSWTAHIRLTLCHFSSPNLSNTPSKFSGLIKLQSSHVSLCHIIGVAPLLRAPLHYLFPSSTPPSTCRHRGDFYSSLPNLFAYYVCGKWRAWSPNSKIVIILFCCNKLFQALICLTEDEPKWLLLHFRLSRCCCQCCISTFLDRKQFPLQELVNWLLRVYSRLFCVLCGYNIV